MQHCRTCAIPSPSCTGTGLNTTSSHVPGRGLLSCFCLIVCNRAFSRNFSALVLAYFEVHWKQSMRKIQDLRAIDGQLSTCSVAVFCNQCVNLSLHGLLSLRK